jgi:hypothetical protein
MHNFPPFVHSDNCDEASVRCARIVEKREHEIGYGCEVQSDD